MEEGKQLKQLTNKRRTTMKRRFHGNQHSMEKDEETTLLHHLVDDEQANTSTSTNPSTPVPASASASKINLTFYHAHDEYASEPQHVEVDNKNAKTIPSSSNIDTKCMYMLANVKILLNLFALIGKCPECSSDIECALDYSNKKGLAQKVVLSCEGGDECGWNHTTYLSDTVKVGEHNRFDVNVRSIIAFREIGRGMTHIERFNRVMNMCPPFSHSNYDEMVKNISSGNMEAMIESMQGAALNVQACAKMHNNNDDNDKGENDDDDDNNIDAVEDIVQKEDSVVNCDVSLDGAWQRRGYASLNGFMSAIERVGDKVVDAEIMTKSCRTCTIWKNKQADPGYANWKSSHDCLINHKGFSTSMESEGAVKIFNRSIDKYNLRYVNYIGDGDSSSFSKVVDSNPYPGTKVNKLECVGHIQKRVDANLIKLTQEN